MEYRLYMLNAIGKIEWAHTILCHDDAGAYLAAQKLFQDSPFEIWNGARRVYPAPPQETAKTSTG